VLPEVLEEGAVTEVEVPDVNGKSNRADDINDEVQESGESSKVDDAKVEEEIKIPAPSVVENVQVQNTQTDKTTIGKG